MQILRRSDTVIAFQKAPVSTWLSKVVCQNLLENKKRADFGSKVCCQRQKVRFSVSRD